MIKFGEITQICHVLKLSIKTPGAQQICPTHSPLLQFPKYLCCQLVTSGFNSGFKQMHFNRKLSQSLRRWKTTWHFTSVKSWRCGQKTRVQMQIQRMATFLWNPNHVADIHVNYHCNGGFSSPEIRPGTAPISEAFPLLSSSVMSSSCHGGTS